MLYLSELISFLSQFVYKVVPLQGQRTFLLQIMLGARLVLFAVSPLRTQH